MRYRIIILLCSAILSLRAADDEGGFSETIMRETPSAVITLRSFIYDGVNPENAPLCANKLGALQHYGPTELFSPYYCALYYAYRLHLNPAVNSEMNTVLASGGGHIHLHNLTGELMGYQQYVWWDDLVQLKRQVDIHGRDAAEQYLDTIGKRIDDLREQFCAIKKREQWLQKHNNMWESFVQASPDVDCEEGPACLYKDIKIVAYAMENVPYPWCEEEGQ